MASSDPAIKAKAESLSGKKAKSKPCTEEPSGTKAKKPSGAVLATLEDHLGVKLKKIRIHTGGNIEDIAATLKARAFTIGPDIYFAKKAFAENDILVAHEIVHVVQASGGKLPKPKPGKVLVSKK